MPRRKPEGAIKRRRKHKRRAYKRAHLGPWVSHPWKRPRTA